MRPFISYRDLITSSVTSRGLITSTWNWNLPTKNHCVCLSTVSNFSSKSQVFFRPSKQCVLESSMSNLCKINIQQGTRSDATSWCELQCCWPYGSPADVGPGSQPVAGLNENSTPPQSKTPLAAWPNVAPWSLKDDMVPSKTKTPKNMEEFTGLWGTSETRNLYAISGW